MNQSASVAQSLTESLNLQVAPVAICVTDKLPQGVSKSAKSAAAGCMFWERGADQTFFTVVEDHKNCAIGMYTHHMPMTTESDQANLGDCLKVFGDLGYVRPEDIPGIPVLKDEAKYVVYSPLASAPLPPAVVLLFLNSEKGLIVTEAVQQVEPNIPLALGRPACAIVPQVVNTGKAALSLGCCGARAYLNVLTDDVAVWALPGGRIAEYAERIKVLSQANNILGQFHKIRRGDFEAGQAPSVKESIQRLQAASS
jgi:uncharacterized protein (DUF169 family)